MQALQKIACSMQRQSGYKLVGMKLTRGFATASNLNSLSDSEIIEKIRAKEISVHKLESLLTDPLRAIAIRRQFLIADDTKWSSTPSNQWDSTAFFNRVAVRFFLIFLIFISRDTIVSVLSVMFPFH